MYFTYRDEGRVFQHVGIWSRGGVTVTGFSEPEQVRSLFVTQGVLDAVGVPPHARAVVLARGRHARHAGDRAAHARILAAAIRRGSRRPRPDDHHRLEAPCGDRCHAGRFPISRCGHRRDPAAAVRSSPPVSRELQLYRDRAAQAWRDVEQANADVARMLPIWFEAWPAPLGLDKKPCSKTPASRRRCGR